MKRILLLLMAFGLLGFSLPHAGHSALAENTSILQEGKLPGALVYQIIEISLHELNVATGEDLTVKEWLVKYQFEALTIDKLANGTYELRTGGGLVIVTGINPA